MRRASSIPARQGYAHVRHHRGDVGRSRRSLGRQTGPGHRRQMAARWDQQPTTLRQWRCYLPERWLERRRLWCAGGARDLVKQAFGVMSARAFLTRSVASSVPRPMAPRTTQFAGRARAKWRSMLDSPWQRFTTLWRSERSVAEPGQSRSQRLLQKRSLRQGRCLAQQQEQQWQPQWAALWQLGQDWLEEQQRQ